MECIADHFQNGLSQNILKKYISYRIINPLPQKIFLPTDEDIFSKKIALKILLVEHEKTIRIAHIHMLQELGYYPDTAESGQEALIMPINEYDVIFLNIELPDISGIDVARKIRSRENKGKNTHIIALTEYSVESIKDRCLMAGIDKIITKPITVKALQYFLDPLAVKNKINV